VVPKGNLGGKEMEDNRGVDEVHLLPYGIRDPIGARGRRGGACGEGGFDFFTHEGRGGGVIHQASSSGEGIFGGKKMIQEGVVDCNGVGGVREGGKSGGLSWGDQLFGRPDIVCGGFCEEISPVGSFGSFYSLEVAELSLPSRGVGVGGPQFFRPAGGFCELLSESGEQRGPPGLGFREGA